MSIQPGPQHGALPKRPVSVSSVDTDTQIVCSDYFGAGSAGATAIRNDHDVAGQYLTVQINCMTRNHKPNDGLVHTEVRIFDTSAGASVEIDAGETFSPGYAIDSFQVTANDAAGAVSITIW